jgi:hypothetical protein
MQREESSERREIIPYPYHRRRRILAKRARRLPDPWYYTHNVWNDDYSLWEDYEDCPEGFLACLGRWIRYSIVFSILLMVSGVSYLAFYHAVMPTVIVSRPLYFEYHHHSSSSHHSNQCSNPSFSTSTNNDKASRNVHDNLHSETTPTGPLARIDLRSRQSPWEPCVEHYYDDKEALSSDILTNPPVVIPGVDHMTSGLTPRRAYYLEAVLYVPESVVNRQTGMMGVHIELYSQPPLKSHQEITTKPDTQEYSDTNANDTSDTTQQEAVKDEVDASPRLIAVARRSTRLPHESSWIRTSRQMLCLFLYWIGAMKEEQSIPVSLFRHYVESDGYPLVRTYTHLLA